MSITTGTFPGVRIIDMPDLGAVTDGSSVVAERAGSGRFSARAMRDYVLTDFLSVKRFGAKGDGATNDTAAFQSALNAIAANGGGKLYIPSGDYPITGPLTYSSGWLEIQGAGKNATILFGSTIADLMTFTGTDVTLTDFSVVTPFQTSTDGILFNFTRGNNHKLNRIWTDGGYEVVSFGGDAAHHGAMTTITDCNFVNVMGNAVVYTPATAGEGIISDTQMLGAPTNNGSGILIQAGDTFCFTNLNIAAFKFGVNVTSAFLTGGVNYAANIFAANVLCDGAGSGDIAGLGSGWLFNGTAVGTYVSRVHLSGCWGGSMGDHGFYVFNASDVTFTNCVAINNGLHGFIIRTPSSDVSLVGCTANANSNKVAGACDGIHIVGPVVDFIVTNCRSKPNVGYGGSVTQGWGINIDATANNRYVVSNNNLHGNLTGALVDTTTGTPTRFVTQNIT